MSIRVAITDDHLMLVKGLKDTLATNKNIEIIATYTSGNALLAGLQQTQPDVLLLDIHLPDKTGIELAPIILQKYPAIRILILSGADSFFQIKDMIKQGCLGYLLKSTTDQPTLLQAIESVYKGNVFLDPTIREDLLNSMLKDEKGMNAASAKLTKREIEILKFIVAEYSNQDIADRLFLSLRTVENHRFNIIQKLGVKNTVGLIRKAMELGLMN